MRQTPYIQPKQTNSIDKIKQSTWHKKQFCTVKFGFLFAQPNKGPIYLSDLNRLCYKKQNPFNVQIIFITETSQSIERCKCDEVWNLKVRQNHRIQRDSVPGEEMC